MKVILIRGLPNTGKSTFAKSNCKGMFHIEADMYHMNNGNYSWSQDRLFASHKWCFNLFVQAVNCGMDVVVSNTFTTEKEIQPYMDYVSNNKDVELSIIRMEGVVGDNGHNVPYETIDKMRKRFVDIEREIIHYN